MKKKIILCIFFLILFFSFLIFFYFNSNNEKKLIEKKKIELIDQENREIIEQKIESSNIIEDVSYSAKDIRGNEYFLKVIGNNRSHSKYIFLKSVNGVINLKIID